MIGNKIIQLNEQFGFNNPSLSGETNSISQPYTEEIEKNKRSCILAIGNYKNPYQLYYIARNCAIESTDLPITSDVFVITPQSDSTFYNVFSNRVVSSENSTAIQERQKSVLDLLYDVYFSCKDEIFESGFESKLSSSLEILVKKYGKLAINGLMELIKSERISIESKAETLKFMGEISHHESHNERRDYLIRELSNKLPIIRDSAGVGLSFLDDPLAIPKIEEAISLEDNPMVKDDLQLVLNQLEETRCDSASKESQ